MVDSKGYHILFFKVYRPMVMLRDNYQCKFCGLLSISNHVHHIDGNKESTDLSNMVTLCAAHHNSANNGKLKFAPIQAGTRNIDLLKIKKLLEMGTIYF